MTREISLSCFLLHHLVSIFNTVSLNIYITEAQCILSTCTYLPVQSGLSVRPTTHIMRFKTNIQVADIKWS